MRFRDVTVWNLLLFRRVLRHIGPFPAKPSRFPNITKTTEHGKHMTKKIFVGNLSFQTTESDLDGLFAQVGNVESVSIITDRMTGRSKGFGFVEMSNEDADNAIQKLNGTEFGGRTLTVNEARPPAKREFGSGGGGGRGYGGGGRGRDHGDRGGGRDRY